GAERWRRRRRLPGPGTGSAETGRRLRRGREGCAVSFPRPGGQGREDDPAVRAR
ncbi:hypothetical protein NDU88_006798, partial [Pleurodeles waltl]